MPRKSPAASALGALPRFRIPGHGQRIRQRGAGEGGAHQSIATPLIGMAQDRLASFEPAYADELAVLMRHGFAHMQADGGSSVWLRLSTRTLDQPARVLDEAATIAGGYWLHPPSPGARIAIVDAAGDTPIRLLPDDAHGVPFHRGQLIVLVAGRSGSPLPLWSGILAQADRPAEAVITSITPLLRGAPIIVLGS